MKICVCLDKNNGMMFFGKRQSQDRVQREKMLEIIGNNTLWISNYSAKLFDEQNNIKIDDNYISKANDEDYCFVEDKGFDISKTSTVILYRWNRQYQADVHFNTDLKAEGFKLISKQNFSGSSHEKITQEIYER